MSEIKKCIIYDAVIYLLFNFGAYENILDFLCRKFFQTNFLASKKQVPVTNSTLECGVAHCFFDLKDVKPAS